MRHFSSDMERYRAVVYHGGAGGGLHRSFENFSTPLLYVSFEPNSQSQDELLQQKESSTLKSFISHDVVNAAVSNTDGKKKFNEYYPFIFSSFLPLNKNVSWRYSFEKVRLLNSTGVSCTTIDQVAKKRREHPRFVCLDIQGYELKTLQGASSTLNREIIGVRCEINFLKIYQNMPSLDEISSYMERKGFFLARIEKCGSGKIGISTDCGPYSRSWDDAKPAWADAIYLKSPSKLLGHLPKRSDADVIVAQYLSFCKANACDSLGFDLLHHLKNSELKSIPKKFPDRLRHNLYNYLSQHLNRCDKAKLGHAPALERKYRALRREMKHYLKVYFS